MNIRISAIALSLLIGSSFAADPRMEQGAIFEAKGNYEMALGEYRAMLAEDPKNSEAYFAAAEVRVKMKDYSGALANYRLAYKFSPKMSAAYEGAAKVYELLGQKAKAADERAKDPKNHPEPVEDAAAIAAAAAPEAASAVSTPAEPKAEPAKVAEAPKAEEKPAPKAEKKAEPAPVAEPAKPEPAKVAEAPKPEAKPEPKTAAAPKAEPKAAPADEPKALPIDPFEKGKVLFAEKNYPEAAKAWREVLKKTPGHAGAYYYAGLTRYEMGEMDKAEFNLKKGLEYKEEGNEANYYLALIYQKNSKVEQEQRFLAAYLKKAGPAAKNRKNAEERLAAIKAAKAEADKAAAEAKAAAAEEKAAKSTESKAEPAKIAEAPKAADAKTAKAAETKAATVAEAAQPAATEQPAAAEIVVEPSIANANMLLTAKSYEAALQMFKTLLDQDLNPDERYYSMLQMGNIYREMRDFHSAVTRYREVVQQFSDSDWATEAERALEDAVWLEKHAKELPKRKH